MFKNALQITQEEIQKTYGGIGSGNGVGCYKGAYRSSTNAYMLMYRQIDSERNDLPMTIEDFPPHIKVFISQNLLPNSDTSE